MKTLLAIAIGLGLLVGTTSFAAPQDTTKTSKKKKKKKDTSSTAGKKM